ncbi:DUF2516 family protein [Ornithinimicrobium pekingense]|uniref:DUF2516 family protein n=1 Tax=Ornithinimicrobium pekingense TaxID=384677 RepID=A0ABQ2FDJ9_9MICO|nr:DUF2516 family protein [Ornithinimicrobium pekingense]GGK77014.1 hypothetical protein GCM10011509_27080 [Ornithinimicrobium pekingense]
MSAIFGAQDLLQVAIGVAVLAMMLWALLDCARTRPDAFVAAGKRTKTFWLVLTGVATVIGFIFVFSPFNIFNLVAVVAAGVYHADVKPALKAVQGRGGQGTHMGPYGPW